MPDNWLQWLMYSFFMVGSAGGWLVVWYVAKDQLRRVFK